MPVGCEPGSAPLAFIQLLELLENHSLEEVVLLEAVHHVVVPHPVPRREPALQLEFSSNERLAMGTLRP